MDGRACFNPPSMVTEACFDLYSVHHAQVAITEKRDMGLYEVPLSVSLLGFWIWTMLANFHV